MKTLVGCTETFISKGIPLSSCPGITEGCFPLQSERHRDRGFGGRRRLKCFGGTALFLCYGNKRSFEYYCGDGGGRDGKV